MNYIIEFNSFSGSDSTLNDSLDDILSFLEYYIETNFDEDYPDINSSYIIQMSKPRLYISSLLWNKKYGLVDTYEEVNLISIGFKDRISKYFNIQHVKSELRKIYKNIDIRIIETWSKPHIVICDKHVFEMIDLNKKILDKLNDYADEFYYTLEGKISLSHLTIDTDYGSINIKILGTYDKNIEIKLLYIDEPITTDRKTIDFEVNFIGDKEIPLSRNQTHNFGKGIENYIKSEMDDYKLIQIGTDLMGLSKIYEMISLLVRKFHTEKDILDYLDKLEELSKTSPDSLYIEYNEDDFEFNQGMEIIIHHKGEEYQAFLMLDRHEFDVGRYIRIYDYDDNLYTKTDINKLEEDLFLYISENW